MNSLIGKIIYRETPPTNRYGYNSRAEKEFLKIIAKDKHYDNEETYLVVNLINRKINWLTLENLKNECYLCPTIEKEDTTVIMHGEYTLYLKDFYLHRVGGPAYISPREKKYYILGKAVSKEDYMDAMPEDVQTQMAFKINEL